jgi:uncharacterized protein YjeT (DUF2065 family)
MDIPLIVAKILGIYLVVSGLFVMFKGKTLPHMLEDFFNHQAIVYLTGVILLFLSSLYLLQSNIWDGTWRTTVTVIMWLTLFKGLLYIFAPQILKKMISKKMFASLGAYGSVMIAAGVVLYTIA